MRVLLYCFFTAIIFVGCVEKGNTSVDSTQLSNKSSSTSCSNDLVQQALANNTCLVCHTDTGLEEFPTSRVDLFRLGSINLLKEIDKLKQENDSQHKELLDTLTTEEVDCLVDYIMSYREIQLK